MAILSRVGESARTGQQRPRNMPTAGIGIVIGTHRSPPTGLELVGGYTGRHLCRSCQG